MMATYCQSIQSTLQAYASRCNLRQSQPQTQELRAKQFQAGPSIMLSIRNCGNLHPDTTGRYMATSAPANPVWRISCSLVKLGTRATNSITHSYIFCYQC